jgi:hypothetical protein
MQCPSPFHLVACHFCCTCCLPVLQSCLCLYVFTREGKMLTAGYLCNRAKQSAGRGHACCRTLSHMHQMLARGWWRDVSTV